MAAGPFFKTESYKQHGVVQLYGSFSCESSGPAEVAGSGFSVSKTSTGVYLVTLDDTWNRVYATYSIVGQVSFQDFVRISAIQSPTQSITMSTVRLSTLIDFGAASEVHFVLSCINTSSYKLVQG